LFRPRPPWSAAGPAPLACDQPSGLPVPIFRLSCPAAFAVGVGAALLPAASWAGALAGSAVLRTPLPLPADAVFEAQLQDVSLADAPAVLVGRVRLDPAGMSPLRFVIPYLDGAIQAGHRYHVRGTITQAGRLLYTTNTMQPVFDGHTAPLQLELVAVGDAPIRGISWLKVPAASVPVGPGAARQEVQLRFDPVSSRVTGSADCNRLVGSFRLEADQLRFSSMAGTRQLCEPEVMADEARFLEALKQVRRWRLNEARLELLDEAGLVLERFETRPGGDPPS
jgi:putative lipoprotein